MWRSLFGLKNADNNATVVDLSKHEKPAGKRMYFDENSGKWIRPTSASSSVDKDVNDVPGQPDTNSAPPIVKHAPPPPPMLTPSLHSVSDTAL